MKPNSIHPGYKVKRQKGVVLFIALIALVALTMAAIGFMRSINTGSMLSGNLAFNRAAVAISDISMEAARAQLLNWTSATCGNKPCLWKNSTNWTAPQNGYFANWQANFDYRAFDWGNAIAVNVSTLTAAQQAALAGFDLRFVVHRMCERAWTSDAAASDGDPVTANCVFNSLSLSGGQNKGDIGYGQEVSQSADDIAVPFYRMTLRVAGPRNSLAYVQVWML